MEVSRRAPAPSILHAISWCMLSANPLSKAARSTFLTARLATGVATGTSRDRVQLPIITLLVVGRIEGTIATKMESNTRTLFSEIYIKMNIICAN